MPSSRELKKLLQPLLERRPDLAFTGRMLFFQPFTHYIQGVVFVAFWSTTASRLVAVADQLCSGADSADITLSNAPFNWHMRQDWKDDIERTSNEMCDKIEQYLLPAVQSITDHVRHHESEFGRKVFADFTGSRWHMLIRVYGLCSDGAFDEAEKILSGLFEGARDYPEEPVTEAHKYHDSYMWRALYLLRQLRTDRDAIPQLLHDREAFSVNAMKITKYWRSTPFPCER